MIEYVGFDREDTDSIGALVASNATPASGADHAGGHAQPTTHYTRERDQQPRERLIRVFDTTLRDGEQSPGASMTLDEKLLVAVQLVRLGVDVIEAGFPAA